ncbi:MAG: peptidase C14 caspase catalytic subunit p20 [bacterium P3]|nr:MAG: peptidase C14 caspase catalytic subunit p20 [bacterium P3]KWW40666.1 MAG: peptidase C14 caspase catalytic subunit p20 [bacterium F083]
MKSIHILPLLLLLITGCQRHNMDLRDKTPEEKLNILDVKIRHDKKNARLYAQRAEVFLELDRVNDAINDLGRATSLDNDNPDYLMRLGDAYFRNGNVDRSYESLQRALELKPDDKEIILKLGEIAFYSRDYDRALDHLTQVTAKDANNRTALFMKSFIYKEKGDTASAVTLLDKICSLHPDYAPAFEELGMLYAARRSPLAAEYYATALRLDPDNDNVRYGLAMYHQSLGRYEQAEAIYKEIIEHNENAPDAWHNRGYIQLFHYGDYELAIDYFTHAIACDTAYVEAFVNRAVAYELSGDNARAREDYQHALQLRPDFQPAIDGASRLH